MERVTRGLSRTAGAVIGRLGPEESLFGEMAGLGDDDDDDDVRDDDEATSRWPQAFLWLGIWLSTILLSVTASSASSSRELSMSMALRSTRGRSRSCPCCCVSLQRSTSRRSCQVVLVQGSEA